MSAPPSFRPNSLDNSNQGSFCFPASHPTHLNPDFADNYDEPEIPRLPLPISNEYDMIRDTYFSNVSVDRSKWLSELLKTNPEIKELRDRVLPLDRAVEFGRLYLPDDRLISQNVLLSLISQHLRTLGLVESQSSLHSEWDGPFVIPSSFDRSQLTFLIQRGVYHAERFWELTMPGTMPSENDQHILFEEISRVIGGSPVIQANILPLSDEAPEDPHFMTVKESDSPEKTPVLRFASVNQLIWICTTDSQYRSDNLLHAFCLTYKSFIDSSVLFHKIRERFRIAFEETPQDKMRRSVELTFTFLSTWLKESSKDIDSNVLSMIRSFIETDLRQRFPRLCQQLQEITDSQANEEIIDYSKAPKVELGPVQSLWSGDFHITFLPPKEFARQLTINTSKWFMNIKQSEFLDNAWVDARHHHLAPNIVHLYENLDRLGRWLAYLIVSKPPQPEWTRLDTVNYVMRVSKHLFKMQNYHDCSGVIGSFVQLPTSTFNKIREQWDKKLNNWYSDTYNLLFNYDGGAKKQLDLSENALKTGKPVFPTFIAQLNVIAKFTAAVPHMHKGQVDVIRCSELYKFIKKIQEYQKQNYCFLPIDQAQDFFDSVPNITSNELYQISKQIE